MRKLAAAAVILMVSVGVAMAEEFGGILKKVEGDKITVTKFKKGEKGEDVTLTVAANVKVVKGKFNKETKKFEAGDALEGGLKNAAVKAGAFVRITTDNDNKVTEIRVAEGLKKKGKDKN